MTEKEKSKETLRKLMLFSSDIDTRDTPTYCIFSFLDNNAVAVIDYLKKKAK